MTVLSGPHILHLHSKRGCEAFKYFSEEGTAILAILEEQRKVFSLSFTLKVSFSIWTWSETNLQAYKSTIITLLTLSIDD